MSTPLEERGLLYELNKTDDEWILVGVADKKMRDITIPDYIFDKPVTTIGYKALAEYMNLETVVLGKYIARIDEFAFLRCYHLKSVVATPRQIVPVQICNYAFTDCKSLKAFVSRISHVGEKAFHNCMNLEYCKIGLDCKEIEDYAFDGCVSLEKFYIESNPLESICINPETFWGSRIFELHCQRNVEFISRTIMNKRPKEEYIHEATKIYCPNWSNLTDFAYFGRSVILEETCQ